MSDDATRFFQRNLIGLTVYFTSRPPVIISGVVLRCQSRMFFVTAGHCLIELKQAINENHEEIVQIELNDTLGFPTGDYFRPITTLKKRQFLAIDCENPAVDCGFFELDHLSREILSKNNAAVIDEDKIGDFRDPDFYRFMLSGIPLEYTKLIRNPAHSVSISPTIIIAEPNLSKEERDKYRLRAQIVNQTGIDSLKGMSGGPIFAFSKKFTDRYYIVAIQSPWKKEEKTIFGCDIMMPLSLIKHYCNNDPETNAKM